MTKNGGGDKPLVPFEAVIYTGDPETTPFDAVRGPLKVQLVELDILTTRKNEGYAGAAPEDPWSNYRSAESFGLTALDSALLRFAEKHNRVGTLYSGRGEDKVGESIR